MKPHPEAILAFLLALFAVAPALAQAPQKTDDQKTDDRKTDDPKAAAPKYVRFRETGAQEGVLEAAIGRYMNADGVRVDLVAAVHIADDRYYQDLNRRFAGYDAVLYEMIKPEHADPTRRAGGAITSLQRFLKRLLDLEFQLDAIDYGRPNFVHADMDPATFQREQETSGESLFKLLVKSALKQWMAELSGKQESMGLMDIVAALAHEDSARRLKYLFAREMEKMDDFLTGLGGKDGSVIVEGRNKVAMRVLKKQIRAGKKKLAIFYGGGHMLDLSRRLRAELGMKAVSHDWLLAWDFRTPATKRKQAEEKARKAGGGKKKESREI